MIYKDYENIDRHYEKIKGVKLLNQCVETDYPQRKRDTWS